jgi:hypothetical protein
MQEELGRVQETLGQQRVEGSAGGGMVVAVANGRQQLVSLRIDKEVVDSNDVPMLEDLVVAAVNHALTKAAELAQQEMAKVTAPANLKLTGLL